MSDRLRHWMLRQMFRALHRMRKDPAIFMLVITERQAATFNCSMPDVDQVALMYRVAKAFELALLPEVFEPVSGS